MSKTLANYFDHDRVEFSHLVKDWEARAGGPAHDIKLYSDMRSKAIQAVKKLGLDPVDTINAELYFALQERARQDNDRLANLIGVNDHDSPDQLLNKVTKWILKNSHNIELWMVRPTTVRAIIKKNPPKNVMKSLGLRSVDSMLKRDNIAEILSLGEELENNAYKQKLINAFKKIKVSDFDQRKVTFDLIDSKRVEKLQKTDFNVSKVVLPNYILGSVTLVPPKSRFPLDVLAITLVISESLSEMRRHSAFYRTLSVRPDFGEQFARASEIGIYHASRSLSEIGWNSIHKHLVGNEDFFNNLDQPYLSIDEFKAEPAVHMLSRIDPYFEYWKDLEYVFYSHNQSGPVSLNLIDVVINASNKHSYHKRSLSYAKNKLWEELWTRYLLHEHIADDILTKFVYG
jgi:hypothetical protein